MKYLLLVYGTETMWTDDERAKCMAESTQLCHDLSSRGQYLSASPLHPVATATCVRVRGGGRLTTDGPFAETTEQLGGYFLIDVANLNAGSRVVFGAIVELADVETDERRGYQIVGDLEADIKQSLISISSPIARALIGKHEGDTITIDAPAGKRDFEIVGVSYET